MLSNLAALLALAAGSPAPLTVVVMDPLAAELSCPCVKGYAQRDYKKLAEFIAKKIGRPVNVHFAETLTVALTKKTAGKADLIIGKDSVVRFGAKQSKLAIRRVAGLTGKDGKTTMTGLVVVPAKDPAVAVGDLKGYRLIFGTEDADEKYAAAIKLLGELKVAVPDKKETCPSCSTAATKLVEAHKKGEKAAAVVSSYAQPLLEGCGTVKKGELRVIGETEPVHFISAFVSAKMAPADQEAVTKALLEVSGDAGLCKAMETKAGFVKAAVPAAVKKK